MAVVLTSATRAHALPCAHFTAQVDIDGARSVVLTITVADLAGPISDDEIRTLLKLWARYQSANGKALAQLPGGTIFSVLP